MPIVSKLEEESIMQLLFLCMSEQREKFRRILYKSEVYYAKNSDYRR